ncbi:hypothetical protein ES703_84615 [subsurface metagenome]
MAPRLQDGPEAEAQDRLQRRGAHAQRGGRQPGSPPHHHTRPDRPRRHSLRCGRPHHRRGRSWPERSPPDPRERHSSRQDPNGTKAPAGGRQLQDEPGRHPGRGRTGRQPGHPLPRCHRRRPLREQAGARRAPGQGGARRHQVARGAGRHVRQAGGRNDAARPWRRHQPEEDAQLQGLHRP